MRNVSLFIAMSLDGYIAGADGNVDWLQGQESGRDDMTSYYEFSKTIDTVVMGWNTYYQVSAELSPDKWMYDDLESYVITHREIPDKENIRFVNEDVSILVKSLTKETGKDIWICGGASIIQPLIRDNLIDRYYISIIPVILGNGIRLFERADAGLALKLIKSHSYNGITDVIYERR